MPPMFYRSVVALSRERHKGWFIDPDQGFSFAADTNSVFVAATEFGVVAREHTIVFARDGSGKAVPAVLLGLQRDKNLLVDGDGRWLGTYVPAYLRRYPFILASPSADSVEFTVCIDEAYSGFNTVREGERLIEENGEQGELLSKSVKFLQDFHQHTIATNKFCEIIDNAGLLDSMQANISLNSGASFSLSGFFSVTRDKLKQLPAERLKEFLDNGYLDLIYAHMQSLVNIDKLMQIFEARLQNEAAAQTKQ